MVSQRRAARDLCLFLAAFFVVWTLRATWFYAVDESIASPTLRAAYSDLLKFLLWVLPAAAFARWLRTTSPVKYLGLSLVPSLRSGWLCLAVTAIFLVAVALFEVIIGRKSFSGASLLSLSPALVLLQLVISPLFEEILFRGLIMKEVMTLLPAPLANALTSLLFMGVHLPYWLSHGGLTQMVMANAVGVFLFSVVACWLYARTASVWPPTLAHMVNNLLSSMLVASRA
jgi:membrane protease YdiL (CAAX protease family)